MKKTKTRDTSGLVREGERFFDTWTPEMAWCLGVMYEKGCAGSGSPTTVETRDERLLRAVRRLLKESRLLPNCRALVIDSPYMSRRLCELGMAPEAFHVRSIPEIPEECVRYLIRGVLEANHCHCDYMSPSQMEMHLTTSRRKVALLMERALRARGYVFPTPRKDIDFHGIETGEPVSAYEWTITLTRPSDVIGCCEWLFGGGEDCIPLNETRKWILAVLEHFRKDLLVADGFANDGLLRERLERCVLRDGDSQP